MIEAMRARLVELSSGGLYSTAVLRHSLAELDADQLSLELRLEDERLTARFAAPRRAQ